MASLTCYFLSYALYKENLTSSKPTDFGASQVYNTKHTLKTTTSHGWNKTFKSSSLNFTQTIGKDNNKLGPVDMAQVRFFSYSF